MATEDLLPSPKGSNHWVKTIAEKLAERNMTNNVNSVTGVGLLSATVRQCRKYVLHNHDLIPGSVRTHATAKKLYLTGEPKEYNVADDTLRALMHPMLLPRTASV